MKTEKKEKRPVSRRKRRTPPGRQYELAGIAVFVAGIFLCISLLGKDAGIFGSWLGDSARFLFGMTAILPGLFLLYLGGWYIYKGAGFPVTKKTMLILALYVLCMGWIHHFYVPAGREMDIDGIFLYGGIIGGALTWGFHVFLGGIGTTVVLFALSVLGVLLLTHWSLTSGVQVLGARTETQMRHVQSVLQEKKAAWEEKKKLEREEARQMEEVGTPEGFLFRRREEKTEDAEAPAGPAPEALPAEREDPPQAVMEPMPAPEEPAPALFPEEALPGSGKEAPVTEEKTEAPAALVKAKPAAAPVGSDYHFPPLSLLHEGKAASGSLMQEARSHVEILESTLKSFGVTVKITDVSVGPTVTRYELEPGPGVKVSRITNLQDDIALQLAATHIRIEAPIPGKSAVGIEVPNSKVSEVPLRDVLESSSFQNKKGGVPVALGKDITGRPVVTDLTKMPHLLIAGSTGSGKSVCINTLITSILYHERPEDVRLILIDPKVVELSVYNGIPHLFIPVVTEARKAAGALHWAVKEMESRYQQFSFAHVREIGGYNKLHPEKPMPFIVIIIDELADLMMAAPDSVEDAICRLAQKARAAGIHLVLATQRPSVDVITGVIKANIPSRISFAVSSQVDSRTILDMSGAEKLIGKGDMLFNPIGAPNPIRVQGAFISDEEVEQVTAFIKAGMAEKEVAYESINLELPDKSSPAQQEEEEDALLKEAAEWLLDPKNDKKASVSMLQRRFRIGYTRAGRLMDTLERMGMVGPAEGAKPREVLMNWGEAEEKFFQPQKPQDEEMTEHGK